MNRFILILLLHTVLFIPARSTAQQTYIRGQEGNRPLTWADFTGQPDETSPYFAYTFWEVKSKYRMQFRGDTVIVSGPVWVELGDKSWVKPGKQSNELLNHEQGHFTIGRLCMLELAQKMKTTAFSKTRVETEIDTLFDTTIGKYKAMSVQYDTETDHGSKKEIQAKWDAVFKSSLHQSGE